MIKYLIIDDEHMAHDIIKGYCDMLPNLVLQKSCYDAIEALQYLNEHQVDLIFLDLNMPKLKGFDFLKTLASPPKVIVTTAYSEFALEGYDLNVVDYLLKPFGFERFLKAVNKAITTTEKTQPISDAKKSSSNDDRIFLRGDKKHTQFLVDDILYIEAAGNYTKVISSKETITTRDKISNLLTLLPTDDFLQVHKSFAIAIKHIKSVEGNQITIGDHVIPIGKVYKLNVDKLLL
jgi:DNA-binding LytR/AlgR family response regulator